MIDPETAHRITGDLRALRRRSIFWPVFWAVLLAILGSSAIIFAIALVLGFLAEVIRQPPL